MKYLLTIMLIVTLAGCNESEEQKAARMLARIDSLYEEGHYKEVLDSIVSLRSAYPSAVETRKKTLKVWQNASLKLAQDDIARTDVLLQETLRKIEAETDLRQAACEARLAPGALRSDVRSGENDTHATERTLRNARKAAAHAMHDALQCFHYRKYLYRQNKMIIFVAGYEHNEN